MNQIITSICIALFNLLTKHIKQDYLVLILDIDYFARISIKEFAHLLIHLEIVVLQVFDHSHFYSS